MFVFYLMASRVRLVLEIRHLDRLLEVLHITRDTFSIENSCWHERLADANHHVIEARSKGGLPDMALLEYCGYCGERRLATYFQYIGADHSIKSVRLALSDVYEAFHALP